MFGSARTDPDQFKRVFEEGLLKDKFDLFEASFPLLTSKGVREPRSKLLLGKSKQGLTNGGLSPKFSEKIGGKSFLENRAFSGQIGAFFRADRGLFGADRDQFLRTPQPRGKSRNCPERALFGPIGAFRAKPPFAKPPFGFSPYFFSLRSCRRSSVIFFFRTETCWDFWREFCGIFLDPQDKGSKISGQISENFLGNVPWRKHALGAGTKYGF